MRAEAAGLAGKSACGKLQQVDGLAAAQQDTLFTPVAIDDGQGAGEFGHLFPH